MTFAQDTFTDVAATLLQSHTPNVGGSWSKHVSSGADASIDSTGARAQTNSASSGASTAYLIGTPPSADYTVAADIIRTGSPAGTHAAGVLARAATGTGSTITCYEARHDTNNGTPRWQLGKRINNTLTSLGTSAATLTQNQSYRVELVCQGSSISLKVDGVTVIGPITDTDITQVGQPGIRWLNVDAYRIDNFEAAALGQPTHRRRGSIDPSGLRRVGRGWGM